MTVRYFIQGRVYATGPDDAAMRVRDKHQDYDGGLAVFRVSGLGGGWWEYMLERGSDMRDSGNRRQFETGAVRDMAGGKGRFDLIPPGPLMRLARHYEAGAVKYGERNWEKGIDSSSYIDSALRHIIQYMGGCREEDHLAAVVFNVFGLMYNEVDIPVCAGGPEGVSD